MRIRSTRRRKRRRREESEKKRRKNKRRSLQMIVFTGREKGIKREGGEWSKKWRKGRKKKMGSGWSKINKKKSKERKMSFVGIIITIYTLQDLSGWISKR